MTTKATLDKLVEVAPELISAMAVQGHCVMATSIGQMVLHELGISADPYPVQLTIVNHAWIAWQEAGQSGGQAEQLRRGAYIITNRPDWHGASFKVIEHAKPWDGHLVLRVPDNGQDWLVDLDLGSYNRPMHKIRLPLGVVAPLTNGMVGGTFEDRGCRTYLEYRPLSAPYAHDYQRARDWTARTRFIHLVDTLVREIQRAM